eukprot:7687138-Prorocentrum_lima.AAC.1
MNVFTAHNVDSPGDHVTRHLDTMNPSPMYLGLQGWTLDTVGGLTSPTASCALLHVDSTLQDASVHD